MLARFSFLFFILSTDALASLPFKCFSEDDLNDDETVVTPPSVASVEASKTSTTPEASLIEQQLRLLVDPRSHLAAEEKNLLLHAMNIQEKLIFQELEAVYQLCQNTAFGSKTTAPMQLILLAKNKIENWKAIRHSRLHHALTDIPAGPKPAQVFKYVDNDRLAAADPLFSNALSMYNKMDGVLWLNPLSKTEYLDMLQYAYRVLEEGRNLQHALEKAAQTQTRPRFITKLMGNSVQSYEDVQELFIKEGISFKEPVVIGRNKKGEVLEMQVSSPVLLTEKHGTRRAIIGKVINTATKQKSYRVFYTSQSGGIFRLLPAINQIDVLAGFEKAIGEFALPVSPQLQKIFSEQFTASNPGKALSQDLLQSLVFHNRGVDDEQVYQVESQLNISFTTEVKHLVPQDLTRPHKNGSRSYADPSKLILAEEDMPDFTQPALFQYPSYSQFSGELTAFVYLSKDKNLQYTIMQERKTGRIWVAQVNDPHAAVSEFGIPTVAIDAHELTMPLWEYLIHTPLNFVGNPHPLDDATVSAWNYVKEIPLIKKWYQDNRLPMPN